MELFLKVIEFIFYTILIVGIAKYVLVKLLRNFAESLNLNPKIVGNIAGVATSIPELLTITLASVTGLVGAGIYNVISSNAINLILYLSAIAYNKNVKIIRNTAITIDLIMVLITIAIPIALVNLNIELNLGLIPLFVLLCVLFYFINYRTHNYYLKENVKEIDEEILEEVKYKKNKRKLIMKYSLGIIVTGIALYFVGELLSNTLETLCLEFGVQESIMGIVLGVITSIPELMTFFESQESHKKNSEVGVVEATNNLLTSNILNLFVIQSIGITLFSIFH